MANRRSQLSCAILGARGIRTRRDFAETLGVTEQTVLNWESGRTRPSHRRHIQVLAKIGVPLALLIDGDDVATLLALILSLPTGGGAVG